MKRNTRKSVRFDAPKKVPATSWDGRTYEKEVSTIKQLPLYDFVEQLCVECEGIENPMIDVDWLHVYVRGTRDETPKERARREARLAKKVEAAQAEVDKAQAKLDAAKAAK